MTLRFLQMWLPQTLQTEASEVTGVGASWVPLPSTFDAALFRPYSNHRSPSDPIPFQCFLWKQLIKDSAHWTAIVAQFYFFEKRRPAGFCEALHQFGVRHL